MTTDTSVKYFNSTMGGAPTLSGTAGALIALLDACLVTGFGSVTLDSLVINNNIATATKTGHGFSMNGNTGPVILIGGATPAGLNTEFRIQSVPSASAFTFITSGISDQAATGTITAKLAPAGFEKAFSITNGAAYRSFDIAGTRLYLQVTDTGTVSATMQMYEDDMVGLSTGTLSSTVYFTKSTSANTTAREWFLFSDSRAFYIISSPGNAGDHNNAFAFGDLINYKDVDPYSCFMIGQNSGSYVPALQDLNNASNAVIARSYSGGSGAVGLVRYSHGRTTRMGYNAMANPNPVDGRNLFWPVEGWEGTSYARGMMPGLWNPIHATNIADKSIITNIPELDGGDILVLFCYATYGQVGLNISGPWR